MAGRKGEKCWKNLPLVCPLPPSSISCSPMALPASFALQKRLASSILNCGRDKVKLNPLRLKEISEAKTRTFHAVFWFLLFCTLPFFFYFRKGAKVTQLLENGAIRRVSTHEHWTKKLWKPPAPVNLNLRLPDNSSSSSTAAQKPFHGNKICGISMNFSNLVINLSPSLFLFNQRIHLNLFLSPKFESHKRILPLMYLPTISLYRLLNPLKHN